MTSSHPDTTPGSSFFRMVYQTRMADMDTVQSVLAGLDNRFGDDFYERVMKKGILNHVFTQPDAAD